MEPKKINGVFHSLNNKNIEEITKSFQNYLPVRKRIR